jgi:hypothetical protein
MIEIDDVLSLFIKFLLIKLTLKFRTNDLHFLLMNYHWSFSNIPSGKEDNFNSDSDVNENAS